MSAASRFDLISRLASLALVGVLALVACKPSDASQGSAASSTPQQNGSASATAELKELTVDEVDQRIAANDVKFKVFDANEKETFDSGHVPTAKWVPSNAVTADMLPADKSSTLVFYCANEH